jgi:mRNA interferase MazF
VKRGHVYWANLGIPEGHEPGHRRPVVVVQSDLFNASAIPTVLVAPLTSNMKLAKAPGNIKLSKDESGLPKDSVVNVSQIVSINRSRLDALIGELEPSVMFMLDNGIRLAFDV